MYTVENIKIIYNKLFSKLDTIFQQFLYQILHVSLIISIKKNI